MSMVNLINIRTLLDDLDKKIVKAFAERAEFHQNLWAYRLPVVPSPDADALSERELAYLRKNPGTTFFELKFWMDECNDARLGRFQVFGEQPFHRGLPKPIIQRELPASEIPAEPTEYYIAQPIQNMYLSMIPVFCPSGDDKNYGDAVTRDIAILHAIAYRVRHGELVIHIKQKGNINAYTAAADIPDIVQAEAKLRKLLTNEPREEEVKQNYSRHALSLGMNGDLFRNLATQIIEFTTIVEVQRAFDKYRTVEIPPL